MSETTGRAAVRAAVIVLLLAAAGLVYLRGQRIRIDPPERAPEISRLVLRDADGRTIDLAELRGQVIVLNAWAGWCGPCRAEVPGFNRVYETCRDRGLAILGLNVEGHAPGALAGEGRDIGIRYPIVVAAGPFEGTFGEPSMIPHSWFIDRRGRLRASHAGYIGEGALRAAVERLLEE